MMNDHVLNLPTRRRVFEIVQQEPGIHLRGVGRHGTLPLGTAVYHLDCLVRAGLVTVRHDGRYKRYFTTDGLGRREKDYAMAARRDVPRRMLKTLLENGRATQRELASSLGVSRSTLSAHAKNLVRQEILACEERWPENFYRIQEPDVARATLQRLQEESRTLRPTSPEPERVPAET